LVPDLVPDLATDFPTNLATDIDAGFVVLAISKAAPTWFTSRCHIR